MKGLCKLKAGFMNVRWLNAFCTHFCKPTKTTNKVMCFYLLPTTSKSLKNSYLNFRWIQSLLIHIFFFFFCFLPFWMSMSVFLKITAVNYKGPYLSIDFYMCKSIAGYSPIINIGKLNCLFSQHLTLGMKVFLCY